MQSGPNCTQSQGDGCKAEIGFCEACGYVNHNIPRDSDNAHDELCCGRRVCDMAMCVTHQKYNEKGNEVKKHINPGTVYVLAIVEDDRPDSRPDISIVTIEEMQGWIEAMNVLRIRENHTWVGESVTAWYPSICVGARITFATPVPSAIVEISEASLFGAP